MNEVITGLVHALGAWVVVAIVLAVIILPQALKPCGFRVRVPGHSIRAGVTQSRRGKPSGPALPLKHALRSEPFLLFRPTPTDDLRSTVEPAP